MRKDSTASRQRRGIPTKLAGALATLVLVAITAACGGGTTGQELIAANSSTAPSTTLPAPKVIAGGIDKSSPVLFGAAFDLDLNHHRVEVRGNTAAFMPGSCQEEGLRGGAFAIYHLRAPEGSSLDEPVAIKILLSSIHEDSGLAGQNPLYAGLASPDGSRWEWQELDYSPPPGEKTVSAQDYNSSRSNTTTIIANPYEDEEEVFSLALMVLPPPGDESCSSVVRVDRVSVSSGWELDVLDEGERSSSLPSGLRELDGVRCPDGSHELAYFAGQDGVKRGVCAYGQCFTSMIPETSGSGPNVSMSCSPDSLPHVFSWDSSSGVGPVRWMAPEGSWNQDLYADSGQPGEPFDPTVCPSSSVDDDCATNIVYVRPGTDELVRVHRTCSGVTYEEVVASGLRLQKRPDLLSSEWDSLVRCVARTDGKGGAVYLFTRDEEGWQREVLANIPSPQNPDGTYRSFISGDMNGDGRLDIVCNSPEGLYLVRHDLSSGKTQVDQVSSSRWIDACDVVCGDNATYMAAYDSQTNNVEQLTRLHAEGVVHRDIAARNELVSPDLDESVSGLRLIVDPDDDGDGIGDASCYLLLSHPSPTEKGVVHWTLEVRVNRIDMA